ncbi:MAG: 4Fe-4S dicluster domain-containing protein [Chloroflexi bacterium]|nr:MAG: 4Fe-4S dicluster domain-containing protein [Chloroflexota bacterium]TMF61928.1 MAG: 4Fe-4S dicluster domain-containing protein [Chloroflexota bacterium]
MSEEPSGPDETAADPELSRRDLLKGAAPIVAFIALEAIGGVGIASGASPRSTALADAVIFPDPQLCIGCLTCEVICSQEHRRAGLSDVPRIRIFNDPEVKVSPVIQEAYPDRGSFHQEPCLQCPTAECLYVCPVDALQVEPRTGARFIREDTCVTCGRCAEACPFPISDEAHATNQLTLHQRSRITYDPEKDTFAKCDLCFWREGGPACVERCPVNIRIRQGVLKSDHLCLEAPKGDRQTWAQLRTFQTFEGSPAKGKA